MAQRRSIFRFNETIRPNGEIAREMVLINDDINR